MSIEFTPEQEKQVHEKITDAVCFTNARMLKLIKEHYGEEAYEIFAKANGDELRIHWSKIAEQVGDNSIESLLKHLWESLRDRGDLEYTMEKTDSGFQMKCTKCLSYDIAKRQGNTVQMYYIACESDPYITDGFNPNIGFKRTKTLMQGDNCCDHFYYYKDKNEQS